MSTFSNLPCEEGGLLMSFFQDQAAATAIEYGLIAALISVGTQLLQWN
jgi:Flp/Fap pilin component